MKAIGSSEIFAYEYDDWIPETRVQMRFHIQMPNDQWQYLILCCPYFSFSATLNHYYLSLVNIVSEISLLNCF